MKKFKRILLKLSGEALMGDKHYGLDPARLDAYASEIAAITSKGIQTGIVIGGGNIFRGLKGTGSGIDRVQGDYMGMMATLINGMAIQSVLESKGVKCSLFSGLEVKPVANLMSRKRAIDSLNSGHVVIMSGGTGNPFFTTDTAAVLRALEINADVILKGTRVDGVYTADPEKNKSAVKYDSLTFDQALDMKLKIMDLTAFALCRENKIPVIVFNMNIRGNLTKVISGNPVGTIVNN